MKGIYDRQCAVECKAQGEEDCTRKSNFPPLPTCVSAKGFKNSPKSGKMSEELRFVTKICEIPES